MIKDVCYLNAHKFNRRDSSTSKFTQKPSAHLNGSMHLMQYAGDPATATVAT